MIYTYEDLLAVGDGDEGKTAFVRNIIEGYKISTRYKDAKLGSQYFTRRNATILAFRKWLFKVSGERIEDIWSANYKFCNAFFRIFVQQEVSHLLGNGAIFNDNATKDKLGTKQKPFDTKLFDLGEAALWGAVSYGFWNRDHLDIFTSLEFAPLWGEEDGGLHAGVRFWQLDKDHPLRATLYELDGYTDYIWRIDNETQKEEGNILYPKRPYIQKYRESKADGIEILDGRNYPGFPIIPLWGNKDRQTELVGLREKIDGYDLIQSGFANDLDEASMIYWIIQNAGGMDDVDLVQFLDRLKHVKAAVIDQDGATAEAHTMDVPYAARQAALMEIRDSLYRDAMALDTDKITAGDITATAVNAAYKNLNLKCDRFESCISEFIDELLDFLGIEDDATFKRSPLINSLEETQVIMMAAQVLDHETILNHLPWLSVDEVKDVLERAKREEAERIELSASNEGED